MPNYKKPARVRWVMLIALILSSFLFSGCEKGSLGVKEGAIKGYVMDKLTNKPLADVLVHGTAAPGGSHVYRDAISGGDGSFVLSGLAKGTWAFTWSKYGWLATGTYDGGQVNNNLITISMDINNGETIMAPVLYMSKSSEAMKGTLKGYPVDSVTGAPLTNFTVTQQDPPRYKVFETSQDFREAGWAGLEGGAHTYVITAENYVALTATATISNVPSDLGVIRVTPEGVSIAGTLRNLPGYILSDESANQKWMIWAEAGGKVVATGTTEAMKSSVVYSVAGIPATAGSVAVKCKVRGYDVVTINPSLSIPKQRPGGVIAGVDADFSNIDPIKRDVRVIVRGTRPPEEQTPNQPMENGDIIRVYIRQGGKDIVPYVDCVANNYYAEGYISGVITGWELNFFALNTYRGYATVEKEDTVPENGNSVYTCDLGPLNGG